MSKASKASLFPIPQLTPEQKRLVRLLSSRKRGPKTLEQNLELALADREAAERKIASLSALQERRQKIAELRDSGQTLSSYLTRTEKLSMPQELLGANSTEKFGV